MSYKNLPMILIILDGWGIGKPNKGNAVSLAYTPVMDKLFKSYPGTLLHAHGKYVGLPIKQDGNSEAGHMNIGAGRLVEQDVVKITHNIKDGTFFKNPAFLEAIRHTKNNNSSLHLIGMLSDGMSPHSDPDHLYNLIKLARKRGVEKVYLHLFTDGRDSPKYVALSLVNKLEKLLQNEKIATIMGRFYAMDRKKKWSRTKMAYNALVLGRGRSADSAQSAITEAYNRGESDEFIEPYVIIKNSRPVAKINNGDSVIFFNLRSDRSRQLTKAFTQKNFTQMNPRSFQRKKILKNLYFVAMTDFGPDLDNIITAFPSADLKDTLPMSLKKIRQLYIAETEKYAHVTYFFNGGYPGKVNGEDQYMVPSPDVKSYDQTPLMSSRELAKVVIDNLRKNRYDFTVLNFAAPDMIGHTGNLKAGIKCCEGVDKYLGYIVKAYLKKDGMVLITADHGNIEEMINLKTGEIDTKHSTNPVPFIIVNNNLSLKLKSGGTLGDIAPTILKLLEIKKPAIMTGNSLIK